MTQAAAPREGPRPHGWLTLALIGALAAGAIAGLLGLGVWQLQRRVWKLQLIAQVQARAHAPSAPPPGPAAWPRITAAADAYRRVRLSGAFLHAAETRVTALTDLGAGYWVLTPLRTDAGFTVLINRGFVPSDQADPQARPAGEVAGPVTVTGLLRVSEPRGSALQRNDPAHGLWYSRDVPAIAASRGLGGGVAPYFVDADAAPNPGGLPVGGLTVTAFPNSHLLYAAIWFTGAAMTAAAAGYAAREEVRARRLTPPAPGGSRPAT